MKMRMKHYCDSIDERSPKYSQRNLH